MNNLELEAIGHCIGYGPQNAKFVFFGLEEKQIAAEFSKQRMRAYVNKYKLVGKYYTLLSKEIYDVCPECEDEDKSATSMIYNFYKFIYEGIGLDSIEQFEFGMQAKPVLVGNLFPFDKKRTNNQYSDSEVKWLQKNIESRLSNVIDFLINKAKNNFVFCFGSIWEYKKYFEDFGGIDFGGPKHFNVYSRNANIYFKHSELNLYLFRHPSHNWVSKNQIKEIIDSIKR